MRLSLQGIRKHWAWCGAALTLCLITGTIVLRPGDANATLEPLPPQLARALALDSREARTQLPDGRWLVLERDGSALKLLEDREGSPVLRRWPLTSPRRLASLSLLPSGRVLIWGGVDAKNRPQSAGLWFDPGARTLTPASSLNLSPRAGHAATVLSDGRLLITGGWMPGTNGVAKAELWDERETSAHLADGVLAPARLGHRSRLEADGRVRLFDGVDGQGRKLAQDQIYDPARQDFAAAPAIVTTPASVTAPQLVASTPRTQTRNVATDARLSLRFSEPLRVAELDSASVTLLGPGGFAAVQITPAEAGRLLFVTPRQRMQANSAYSLLVDGVHGRNGKTLATTLIDFETAAGNATARESSPAASDQPASGPSRSTTPRAGAIASATAAPAPKANAVAGSPTLTVDGASLALETSTPNQPASFNFTISQAGDYGLGISGLITSGSSSAATLTIQRPGGSPIALPCLAANDGCGANLSGLAAGDYMATLLPPSGATLQFSATLSRDVVMNIAVNQPYLSATINRRGRNARLSFNANGASHLRIATHTTQPAAREVLYTLYAPNGSVAQSFSQTNSTGLFELATSGSGRYTLLIDPRYGETLSSALTVGAGPLNQLIVDGPTRDYAATVPSQAFTMYLEVGAGDELGLGISNLTMTGGVQPPTLQLRNHLGTLQLSTQSCLPTNGGCDLNLSGLQAGVYTAQLFPPTGGVLSFSATLTRDKVVNLVPGATSELSLERSGRNGRLNFDVAADEVLLLSVSAPNTVPAQRPIGYTLRRSNGSPLQYASATGAKQWQLAGLPAGSYSWRVDPLEGETTALQATLQAASGSTAIGAEPIALSTQANGERATFSFVNSRTRDLGIGIADLNITGASTYADVVVRNFNGDQISYTECYDELDRHGCDVDLPALPAGLFTVEISPRNSPGTLSLRAAVSEDLITTLQPGQPLQLQIPRIGQNAQFDFTAQNGETINLGITHQITDPVGRYVTYAVYNPNGYEVGRNSVGANGSGGVSLERLIAGRYVVRVDPEYGATMSAQVAPVEGVTGELVADGPPQSLSTQLSNQSVLLHFQAEAGANLGLGIDQLSGVHYPIDIDVYKPDGSELIGSTCDTTFKSCAINLPNLEAGTYTIKVDPSQDQGAFGFRATLSSDLELALNLHEPNTLVQERWGRNVRYRFNAGPGLNQTLAVVDVQRLSSPTPNGTPQPRSIFYTLRYPNGEIKDYETTQADVLFRLTNFSVSGEYTLTIDPEYGDALTAQVWLGNDDVLGDVVLNGATETFTAQGPGETLSFGFDLTDSTRLRLGIVSAAIASAGSYTLTVGREGDEGVATGSCAPGGCWFVGDFMPPGRYKASLAHSYGQPVVLSLQATLSTPVIDALTLGQPQALQLRSSQDAILSFHGEAGQRLTLSIADQSTQPTGRSVQYSVYRSDGYPIAWREIIGAGTSLDLPALAQTGEYLVFVSTQSYPSVSTTVRLDPTPTP